MDVLERLRAQDDGRTHFEGCEKHHLLCACALEIERLRADLRAAQIEADQARRELALQHEMTARLARRALDAM